MAAMRPLSFVVMGTGGVGGYFGSRLVRAGLPVTFVARGAHLEALRRDGLRLRSSADGDATVKVDATEQLAGHPRADVVLLCVKTYDTGAALDAIRPVIGPGTAVLSLQNGIDAAERIGEALGPGHALAGVAYVFAALEAPGVVAHRFGGRVVFGELDGRITPRAEALRDALVAAGIPAALVPDIGRALWEKYLFIVAHAGLTAVTRCPTGVVRALPETWRLYRAILDELAAVARAAGVGLAPDIADAIAAETGTLAPETLASMATDLLRGRRLELESLHGYAVRLGEALGVPTPGLFAVYAALKPHVDGAGGTPRPVPR
jgi:2-dehydropantoate 2-reductase